MEREPLPDEIPPLEVLIADHKEFMENTARRQPEVDRACKPRQAPAGTKDRKPSRGASKTYVLQNFISSLCTSPTTTLLYVVVVV